MFWTKAPKFERCLAYLTGAIARAAFAGGTPQPPPGLAVAFAMLAHDVAPEAFAAYCEA